MVIRFVKFVLVLETDNSIKMLVANKFCRIFDLGGKIKLPHSQTLKKLEGFFTL